MKKMHTPGPWYARRGYKMLTISNRKTACINAVTIAEVVNPCGQEYVANANLIAAAPELLEACQLAMQSDIDGSFVSASKWWDIMKVAIKKATS